MELNINALIELAKSAGRFLWFGFLGLVVTFLSSMLTDESLTSAHVTVGGAQLPVGILILAVVTAVIKAIDRYRHVSDNTDSNGIAPKFLQR